MNKTEKNDHKKGLKGGKNDEKGTKIDGNAGTVRGSSLNANDTGPERKSR